MYDLIETKAGVDSITSVVRAMGSSLPDVRAGFESDVRDGAGVTCTSIAIFCFRLSMVIRAIQLTLSDLTASP